MEITSETSAVAVLAIGFLLGLRHATDADHLAAVSTIVSEKKNLLAASMVGGLWGVGHTISLFVIGILVIVLKLQIPESVETRLEAIVGVMLVLLGLNALRNLFTSRIHAHVHQHGTREHVHFHAHGDELAEDPHHRFSPRSILIGMIHGLAGSAALMLLIVPTISSPVVALFYILIFGVGSIGGMMAMSLLIGLPFHFTANRFDFLHKGIRLCAGVFSLGFGCLIFYEKAIA